MNLTGVDVLERGCKMVSILMGVRRRVDDDRGLSVVKILICYSVTIRSS